MADEFQVEDVANAFGAGVDGYLVKAISCEPLGSALRLVAHGEKVIPSQIVVALADPVWRNGARALDTGKLDLNLSDREVERSEEHTSELQSLMRISYAVFCLKKKTKNRK